MRDFGGFAFVLITLVAVGCNEQTPSAAPQPLERQIFSFDGVSYEMQVPANGKVTAVANRVMFDGFSTRQVRFIEFNIAQDDSAERFDRKQALKNGSTLAYRVDYNVGGGSGGTEGELVGRVKIGGRVIAVRCRDQKDGSRPEPEWCFPYVGSLAVVATPQ